MTKKLVIIIVNAILVAVLVTVSIKNDSDKSHLLIMFWFPVLTIANYWVSRYHQKEKSTFKQIIILIVLLYVPVIVFVAES